MARRVLLNYFTEVIDSFLFYGYTFPHIVTMNLYPVFLKLQDKSCLIIGGGNVAARKVQDILQAGGRVTLIAPEITGDLRKLADAGTIRYKSRKYLRGDVKKHFLVIAATNLPGVNREIAREAEKYGVLLNAVDNPENCNFFVPASIKRGMLQIAVSTSGTAPLFAREMREYLEKKIPPGIAEALEEVEVERKHIISTETDPGKKQVKMDKIIKPMVLDIIRGLDRQ